MSTTGWIVLGVIVVVVAWLISIYNGLVAMGQRVGPLLILALVTPSAQAQRRNATLIINGGTLIDGTGAPPVPDAAVVLSGNRIAEVGPSSKIKVSKNTKTIDARGSCSFRPSGTFPRRYNLC